MNNSRAKDYIFMLFVENINKIYIIYYFYVK